MGDGGGQSEEEKHCCVTTIEKITIHQSIQLLCHQRSEAPMSSSCSSLSSTSIYTCCGGGGWAPASPPPSLSLLLFTSSAAAAPMNLSEYELLFRLFSCTVVRSLTGCGVTFTTEEDVFSELCFIAFATKLGFRSAIARTSGGIIFSRSEGRFANG